MLQENVQVALPLPLPVGDTGGESALSCFFPLPLLSDAVFQPNGGGSNAALVETFPVLKFKIYFLFFSLCVLSVFSFSSFCHSVS